MYEFTKKERTTTDLSAGFPVEDPMTDIGISIGDAQAIKHAVLEYVKQGFLDTDDATHLSSDLITAFKQIDNEVMARDAIEKAARTAENARVAGKVLTPETK